jgi:hypothetical protein
MMAIPSYSATILARARKERLHLVKIEINGRHANAGGMAMAAVVGPKMAAKLKQIFVELSDGKTREQ